jgi:hypothetical protein
MAIESNWEKESDQSHQIPEIRPKKPEVTSRPPKEEIQRPGNKPEIEMPSGAKVEFEFPKEVSTKILKEIEDPTERLKAEQLYKDIFYEETIKCLKNRSKDLRFIEDATIEKFIAEYLKKER